MNADPMADDPNVPSEPDLTAADEKQGSSPARQAMFGAPDTCWPTSLDRIVALAAPSLHGRLLRQGVKEHRDAGSDSRAYLKVQVSKLQANGYVEPPAVAYLDRLITLVVEGRAEALRTLYREMVDANVSPIAIAIGGIAADSAAQHGPVLADTKGALTGAAAGSVGGFWGALGGAVLGGAVFSLADAVEE